MDYSADIEDPSPEEPGSRVNLAIEAKRQLYDIFIHIMQDVIELLIVENDFGKGA